MDTFIRRHTLDSLCSCVELVSESGSSPDQTPLLVLIQTLVLGLRNLTDTHHLLTARRIYRLIQQHLEESRKELNQEAVSVPALDPVSFSDWVGLYLRNSDRQVEFSLVLVSVLSQFIQELKSPDQAFKDEEWWNPEHLDTNTCCYLELLTSFS
ncbi:HEAT repeat-containing protein 1-like [Periophthalmus magnuspinnatus]|uniref:HEAT repeat-containing protein 1-like n=1 Tax=Periophthalmus magnuspinnatus TaxID=409849 RepID=UPI002436EE76|nr:HEAT repeat-containing protein 1-like [Periophthalmus magnuspinnatus]